MYLNREIELQMKILSLRRSLSERRSDCIQNSKKEKLNLLTLTIKRQKKIGKLGIHV